MPYRERVISAAQGSVLEIGIGSGLNLPLYSSQAVEIIGLEPAPRLTRVMNIVGVKPLITAPGVPLLVWD